MKSLKLISLLFLAMIISGNIVAQICYIDTLGQAQTKSFKIVELNDKSLLIGGGKGVGGQSMGGPKFGQSVYIKKVDSCNNLIWIKNLDSVYDYEGGYFGNIFYVDNIFQLNDNYIINWIDTRNRTINEVEIDINGNIISRSDFNLGNYISYIKLNTNRFICYKDIRSNNDTLIVNLVDSNSTVLNSTKIWLFRISRYIEVKKTSTNQISFLLKHESEDSAYKIINFDTSANFIDSTQIFFNDSFPKDINFNYTNTGLYGIGDIIFDGGSKRQPYIVKMDLKGNIIKKLNMPPAIVNDPKILKTYENGIMFNFTKTTFVADTNLTLLIKDSIGQRDINGGKIIKLEDVIISSTNQLYQIGWLWVKSGLQSYPYCNEWLKKTPLFNYVKSIGITGSNNINTKGGKSQCYAVIAPSNAENKSVVWSINDTNLALVNQTGLVTAKGDGMVTVSVQTTDGSNLKANKNITITNQTVGVESYSLDNSLLVYPNPVSETLYLNSLNGKIIHVTLLDMNGTKIIEIENSKELHVQDLDSGVYILLIETEFTNYIKKIMIN